MTAEEQIEGLKVTLAHSQERIDSLTAENAELKGKLDFELTNYNDLCKEIVKLKEREAIIEIVYKSLYENMESLPYEVNKLIDENFWELF